MTDELKSSLDDQLLVVKDDQKIQATDIEGTSYSTTLLGGGSLKAKESATASGSATIAAGEYLGAQFNLYTNPKVVTLPVFLLSVYIGSGNNNNNDYLWPLGSALSVNEPTQVMWTLDNMTSDPSTGEYHWFVKIPNTTASPVTYYLHASILVPSNVHSIG